MSIKNKPILISKKSMPTFSLLQAENYDIAYYLQADKNKEIAEDALLVHLLKDGVILAVCDGVGSTEKSYRAAENILLRFMDYQEVPCKASVEQMLDEGNQQLTNLSGSPQTTLSAVVLSKNSYYSIQVGDSGICQVSGQANIKYESNMHSPVGEALRENKISEKQALNHPERHIVSNVLGCQDYYVEFSKQQAFARRDTMLITSDGLLDNLTREEIVSVLRSGNVSKISLDLVEHCQTYTTVNQKEFEKIDDISFICIKRNS